MSDTRGVTFQIWSHSVLQTVIVFNPIPDKIELRRSTQGGRINLGGPNRVGHSFSANQPTRV